MGKAKLLPPGGPGPLQPLHASGASIRAPNLAQTSFNCIASLWWKRRDCPGTSLEGLQAFPGAPRGCDAFPQARLARDCPALFCSRGRRRLFKHSLG